MSLKGIIKEVINKGNKVIYWREPISNGFKQIECEIKNNDCHVVTSHHKRKHGDCYVGKPKKAIYRLVYESLIGVIPENNVVRHKCDNASCCNPKHLEIGLQKDNIHDAISRGRNARGIKVPQAKLTDDKVREIRALLSKGLTTRKIADMYGVCDPTISNINTGKTWKHVNI